MQQRLKRILWLFFQTAQAALYLKTVYFANFYLNSPDSKFSVYFTNFIKLGYLITTMCN